MIPTPATHLVPKHMNHVSTFGLRATVNFNIHYMHTFNACAMWVPPCQHNDTLNCIPYTTNHAPTNKKMEGGDPINPSTLIVPHTSFIRSCSWISCIKSHVTCSTAPAVLEIFSSLIRKDSQGRVNFTIITKLKNTVTKIKSTGRIMCLHTWAAAVSNGFSFWSFMIIVFMTRIMHKIWSSFT